ncbi:MAG: hypothetical protein U0871_13600 [Gemmataceae bacterium]
MDTPNTTPKYLTTSGFGLRYGLAERTVRTLVEKGILRPERIGRAWAFAVADLPEIERTLRAAGVLPTAVPLGVQYLVPAGARTA